MRSTRDSAGTRRWNANEKQRSAKHNVNVTDGFGDEAEESEAKRKREAEDRQREESAKRSANAKNGDENWS